MELVDIVDENNKLTGQVEDRWVPYNKGLGRRTVFCWRMNEKGEVTEVKYVTMENMEFIKRKNDSNYTFCNLDD